MKHGRLRVAHVSDVHIRTLKWHSEYRRAFDALYADLRAVEPDLIICTGDLVHSKTTMSPELVTMLSEHVSSIAAIAPYAIIIGNHDANIANSDREDAVSPVVSGLKVDAQVFRESGLSRTVVVPGVGNVNFWTFSCLDTSHFPKREQIDEAELNIALVHGRISGCTAENGMPLDFEHDVSIFDGFDAVMAGDVHKPQSIGKRIVYAGSLIQQNHGEARDKGYLLWDVFSKEEVVLERRLVSGFGGFFTVKLESLLPDASVPSDAYLRVVVDRRVSSLERREIEGSARTKYGVKHVSVVAGSDSVPIVASTLLDDLDHRTLIARHVEQAGHGQDVVRRALEIDDKVEKESVDLDPRGGSWQLEAFGWNDLFAFGKGNIVDLTVPRGVVGVFGPNAIGKSSVFEVLLECLFDKTTKPVEKNVEMVNDLADSGTAIVTFRSGGDRYLIERTIERIKKSGEKELGKTSLSFFSLDGAGKRTCLNGQTRQETERNVRNVVGSFVDFALSSISAQKHVSGVPGGGNVVECKDSDRSKIFAKFIGLDVFEAKFNAAKELQKKQRQEVERFSQSIDVDVVALEKELASLESKSIETDGELKAAQERLSDVESELARARTTVSDAELRSSVKLEVLVAQRAAAESEVERASDALSSAKNRLDDFVTVAAERERDVTSLDASSISAAVFALESVRRKRMQLESSVELTHKKLAVVQEVAVAKRSIPCGGSFPTCPFVAGKLSNVGDERELRESIERLTPELSSLIEEEDGLAGVAGRKRQLDSAVSALESARQRASLLEAEVRASSEALRVAQSSLSSLKEQERATRDNVKCDDAALRRVSSLEAALVDAKRLLDSLVKASAANSRLIGVTTERLSAMKREVGRRDESRAALEAFDAYVEAVGKHGVPKAILAKKLPAVNDEIAQVLSGIADFSVVVEVSPDQTVTISVDDGERKRDVALASGAQTFIASLGVRIALLNVSSLPRPNFFIVDEGFGSLDTKNFDAIGRAFEYLRKRFDTVFVVSHLEALKDIVDDTIEIVKAEDGRGKVEYP